MNARQALRHVGRLRQREWLFRCFWDSVPIGTAAGVVVRLMDRPFLTAVFAGFAIGFISLLVTGWVHRRVFPTLDRVAAHLDRTFVELEESTGLLLQPGQTLTGVASAQRDRVERVMLRLANERRFHAPASAWHPRAAIVMLGCAALVNLPWLSDYLDPHALRTVADATPVVEQAQLDERRHAYTKLAALRHEELSSDVLEFSKIRWTFKIAGSVSTVAVEFLDQPSVPLFRASQGYWQSDWVDVRGGNYSLMLDGEPTEADGALSHRLVVLPDAPPEISIVQPSERIFSLSENSQSSVTAVLRTDDDFGINALRVVVNSAEGDGEQVEFESKTIDLTEQLAAQQTRATSTLDWSALGAAPGRELYVTFEVDDNRPHLSQTTASASLIVRWARDDTTADIVLDNQIVNIEPELFRSQRQIIIDSEALLGEREVLAASDFALRAQALAFDERALRFRYGAFMGEEASGEPAAGAQALGGETHYPGDGHDHGSADFTTPAQREFGDVMAAIAPYAHFHDQAEQATLFDPETRGLLRQALSAMWRAEGFLLQHDPGASLPHQYQALALIKRVQRRSRKFVRRVGVPITPVDEARRLEGELDEIPPSRALPTVGSESLAPPVSLIDRLLAAGFDSNALETVLAWVQQSIDQSVADQDTAGERVYRDMFAILMTWQSDPLCDQCATQLGALWATVASVPVAAPRRAPVPNRWFTADEAPP